MNVKKISVRYTEFVTSLSILKCTADISSNNSVKVEMGVLLLEF